MGLMVGDDHASPRGHVLQSTDFHLHSRGGKNGARPEAKDRVRPSRVPKRDQYGEGRQHYGEGKDGEVGHRRANGLLHGKSFAGKSRTSSIRSKPRTSIKTRSRPSAIP